MKPIPDGPGLARDRISLLGALTQSIGFMGPVSSIAALMTDVGAPVAQAVPAGE